MPAPTWGDVLIAATMLVSVGAAYGAFRAEVSRIETNQRNFKDELTWMRERLDRVYEWLLGSSEQRRRIGRMLDQEEDQGRR